MPTSSSNSNNEPLKIFRVRTRNMDWCFVMALNRNDAIKTVHKNWSEDVYRPDWFIVEEVSGFTVTEV